MTKVASRFFRNFSALFSLDDKTTTPREACASIQLDAKRRRANIRASAGLLTSRFKSLDDSSGPPEGLIVVAVSLEIVTKLDVRETVMSFWMGRVVLSTADIALNVLDS